jgi:hypothetical protein
LRFLVSKDLAIAGSISVTLISVDEVSDFVEDALAKNKRRKERRKGFPVQPLIQLVQLEAGRVAGVILAVR